MPTAVSVPSLVPVSARRRNPSEVIDPATLDAAERRRLIDELYRCQCRIFEGVGRDAFARYVVDSPATSTRIFVVRDGGGTVRGYCAFHVFDVDHDGRSVTIVRMEAGFEPAWRRGTIYGRFALVQFIRARLHAGRRRLYFVCAPVHPASFVTLARCAPRVWTETDPTLRPETRRFMQSIGPTLGMKSISPGVYQIGWITRRGPVPTRISPEAQRYLSANPTYGQGHGLLTVAPASPLDILRGAARLLRHQVARRLQPR